MEKQTGMVIKKLNRLIERVEDLLDEVSDAESDAVGQLVDGEDPPRWSPEDMMLVCLEDAKSSLIAVSNQLQAVRAW